MHMQRTLIVGGGRGGIAMAMDSYAAGSSSSDDEEGRAQGRMCPLLRPKLSPRVVSFVRS